MHSTILLIAAAATGTLAQQAAYAQCGGQTFTGSTSCVSGYVCKSENSWYSQCLPSDEGGSGASSAPAAPASSYPAESAPPSASASAAPASLAAPSGVASSAPAQSSSSSSSGSGGSYKASFTEYGSGDQNGSGNCNTATTACGFYTSPGYSAAVSQNEFGVGPGAGAGPACGTCWKLTIETDSNGDKVPNAGKSIVVQVTNLCPADGNPLCAQSGLSGTNQYGANMNFDLCIDSGASSALFGDDGTGLGVGSAEEVSCSDWSGTVVH